MFNNGGGMEASCSCTANKNGTSIESAHRSRLESTCERRSTEQTEWGPEYLTLALDQAGLSTVLNGLAKRYPNKKY
jgi:hypothetical protein